MFEKWSWFFYCWWQQQTIHLTIDVFLKWVSQNVEIPPPPHLALPLKVLKVYGQGQFNFFLTALALSLRWWKRIKSYSDEEILDILIHWMKVSREHIPIYQNHIRTNWNLICLFWLLYSEMSKVRVWESKFGDIWRVGTAAEHWETEVGLLAIM